MFDPTAPACGQGLNGWTAAHVFNDWGRYSAAVWASHGCYCVIDEAAQVFDEDRPGARMMLQRGRHNGHVFCLIAQRHYRLDKTAREQCSQVFAFVVSPSDATDLAEDWNDTALLESSRLKPLEYIEKTRHRPARKGRLVFRK